MYLPYDIIEQIKTAPKNDDPGRARELDLNGTPLTPAAILEIRYFMLQFGTRVMPKGGWRKHHRIFSSTRPVPTG